MKNLFGFGLALAASASLLSANGGPNGGPDGVPNGGPNGGPDGVSKISTSLLQDGRVTFAAGKGITFDAGDTFKLNWTNRIQTKWRYVNAENMPDTNGFRMRRVRSKLKGHVWSKDVTYMLQLDFNDTGRALKDIWLKWRLVDSDETPVSVRLGQGKFRAGLESDGSSGSLIFVERSIASRTFADSRSTGALFEGTALEEDMLYWFVGAFNTDTAAMSGAAAEEGTNTGENELNFVAGARFDPQGSMGDPESWSQGDLTYSGDFKSTFGAGVSIVNEAGTGGADVESTTINILAAMKSGAGMAGQGEVWIRSDDLDGGGEADSTGWYLQGSYAMEPREGETQWVGAVRVSMVDFDDAPILLAGAAALDGGPSLTGAAGDVFEINATASALYHEHKLKTQIGYTFQDVSPTGGTDTTNHAVEVMVTATF